MSENVNPEHEILKLALVNQVPGGRVAAGRICLAAMRRAGREVDYEGDMCYYAAEVFSTNCLGNVNADGTEVTDSLAEDGTCLRVQEVDTHLASLKNTAGPNGQK